MATGPLVGAAGPPLVGRDPELAVLSAAWSAALGGERRAVLVHGEPGIGKTRVAAELADAVLAEGHLAVYGRWDEDVVVPYRGFVGAIRALVDSYDARELDELLAAVGPLAAELLLVAPGLAERLPDLNPPRRTLDENEGDRSRIFEAITRTLTVACQERPVLIVLDDLHWAGRTSLGMLSHLLRSGGPCKLLVLGLYRDTEVERDHPLVPVLAELRSVPGVERLALGRLDSAAVAQLLEHVGATGPNPSELYAETSGNPLFLVQVLRHLGEGGSYRADSGRPVPVPEGVSQLVSRRLAKLPADTAALLEVASVVGTEVSASLLAELEGTPGIDGVLDGLEAATRAGFLAELPGPEGRFRFSHALVRRALYESLPRTRRSRLHLEVASTIEASEVVDEGRTGAIAHHLYSGAPLGDQLRAAGYLRLAAEEAMSRLAFEAAVLQVERALSLSGPAPGLDEDAGRLELRAELFLLTSLARFRAGDLDGSRRAAELAADVARAVGSAELLAQAAIRYVSFVNTGEQDPVAIEMCEEALHRLPADAEALRAQVLARLATYVFWGHGDGERALALTEEAIERARRSGDPETLVRCYSSRVIAMMCRPDPVEAAVIADELARVAEKTGSSGHRGDAITAKAVVALVGGDAAAFAAAAEELVALGESERYWTYVAYGCVWRSTLAAMSGQFHDAVAQAGDALRYGGDADDFRNTYLSQSLIVAREQGRLAQVAPMLSVARTAYPGLAVLRPIEAVVHINLDRPDLARAELTELTADGFSAVARDFAWVCSLALLAEVAATLRCVDEAQMILDRMERFQGTFTTAGGVVCLGAVDRYLAMLADVLELDDQADAWFASASELEAGAGAHALLARTQLWHARSLLRRGGAEEQAQANQLVKEAAATAAELGMEGLSAELATLSV